MPSDFERAKLSAPDFDISPERAYESYQDLMDKEESFPAEERVDSISITTPNHTHFPIAKAAIEADFNVFCNKPMTLNLEQADELVSLVDQSGVVFTLNHNYTGTPLVRQPREMVLNGEIGEINAVRGMYLPRLAPYPN